MGFPSQRHMGCSVEAGSRVGDRVDSSDAGFDCHFRRHQALEVANAVIDRQSEPRHVVGTSTTVIDGPLAACTGTVISTTTNK